MITINTFERDFPTTFDFIYTYLKPYCWYTTLIFFFCILIWSYRWYCIEVLIFIIKFCISIFLRSCNHARAKMKTIQKHFCNWKWFFVYCCSYTLFHFYYLKISLSANLWKYFLYFIYCDNEGYIHFKNWQTLSYTSLQAHRRIIRCGIWHFSI